MPLNSGSRIGPYEILAKLGEGGMGEVYRATDSNLKRSVAIKVLPASVAGDLDRLARFQREAEVLAALNHPHVAGIYGLEKTPDLTALVMELVEGEDLSRRIARGPIPIDEALPIAKQLAEALEAAHDAGIIHRDLKPANIKLRNDGTVKVLDFGLAKALDQEPGSRPSLANSPTITSPAMTMQGVILGTAAYMSPEQAAGKPVDKRADLWAFGIVLIEMLTGRTVFEGETVSHVLAAVLKDEPRWESLPPDTPPSIQRLLRRCLQKDRKRRLDSAAVARLEIDDALANPQLAAPAARSGATSSWMPWVVALVAVMSAAVPGYVLLNRTEPTPFKTAFSIPLEPRLSGFAISPDGTQLVFSAPSGSTQQLFLRRLADFAVTPIPGADGGAWPFWSPDSRSVGFFAQGKLKKIELASGNVQALCDAELPPIPGAAWSPNGTVLFITAGGVLRRVSSAGGLPSEVETLAGEPNSGYGRPQFLPDGERFMFFKDPSDVRGMYVSTLGKTGRTKIADTRGTFAPPDQMLLLSDDGLTAQRLDLERLQLAGEPRVLFSDAPPAVSVSDNGVLVYRRVQTFTSYQLEMVDRAGKRVRTVGERGDLYMPRVSPDGSKLAVERHNERGYGDLEIIDLTRDAATRFTFAPTLHNAAATWSPAGDRLAFHAATGSTDGSSSRGGSGQGPTGLFVKPANGLSPQTRLLDSGSPTDWTGDTLILERRSGRLRGDLWLLPLNAKEPSLLLNSPAHEAQGRVSPDGKWLAYVSDESGEREIYVTQFPPAGAKWQLSNGGGEAPVWSRDGTELFFLAPDGGLDAVRVRTQGVFEYDKPVSLFKWAVRTAASNNFWFYDALPDGKRFVGVVPLGERPPAELNVIVNWR